MRTTAREQANVMNMGNLVILGTGNSIEFQRNLNCFLSILRALILLSRVDGGIRSLAAAPKGPEIRPLVSASAASITSRSLRRSTSPLKSADASTRDAVRDVSLESHNSSTEKTSPELRITDLSITFCSSRMLPGQS